MKKRVFSMLLALIMALSLLPTVALAEDEDMADVGDAVDAVEENPEYSEPHDEAAESGQESAKELTADTQVLEGDYYLNSNVVMEKVLWLKSGNASIDLNGHVLILKSKGSGSDKSGSYGIRVDGGTLTIKDSAPTTLHRFNSASNVWELDEENGDKTISGGAITGAANTYKLDGCVGDPKQNTAGGAICIYGGSVVMDGGNIVGNKVSPNDYEGTDAIGGAAVYVDTNASFIMNGGSLQGNAVPIGDTRGGAIWNKGTLAIYENSVISGNYINNDGENHALGGGIYNEGTITVLSGTVSNNTAKSGGGIYNNGTITTLNGSVSGNTADGIDGGGGIFNDKGTITALSAEVSGNTANVDGGGIYNKGTITTLNGSVSSNKANTNGGGIYNEGTIDTLSGSISENGEGCDGGGIYNNGTITTLSGTVSSNEAGSGSGGGIFNDKGTISVFSGTVSGNTASRSGGIYNLGTISVFSGTVSNNTAVNFGGGIFNNGGTINDFSGTVSGNTAEQFGGGIVNLGTLKIFGTASVSDNTVNKKANNVTVVEDNAIQVKEALQNAANIGVNLVTLVNPIEPITGPAVTGAEYEIKSSDREKFFSDDKRFVISEIENNTLSLVEGEKTRAEVTVEPGTPEVTATGLNAVALKEREGIDEAKAVMVELVVRSMSEAAVPEADKTAINVQANGKTVEFLDMGIYKYLNGDLDGSITDTGENVLEIIIPFTTSGRRNITVYRYHAGTATEFTKLSSRPTTGYEDATFYVDSDSVAVYTTKFSTYAIGYDLGEGSTPSPSGGGSGGSGGSVSRYSITIPNNLTNGKLTADRTKARAGSTVTISVSPDKGYTLETLNVLDKNGNEIELTEKDGKYSFKMPSASVKITASFMEDNTMLNFFVDVPADSYYYDAVLWAAAQGITSGTDDTHFSPDWDTTRAQMVTFNWLALGSPEPESSSCEFTDLDPDAYYYKAILWAAENGYALGTSKTTFCPDVTVTRCQIVTFLWRIAGKLMDIEENPFNDVVEGKYYYDAIKWASENGLTEGTSATTFSPDDNCTRAQIVTFLYRYFVK